VGSDANYIKNCDLLVVNSEHKLEAGTSMELVIAKYFKKPVIVVLPKGTHHRKSNVTFHQKMIRDWIHPFIFTFSDFIIEDIKEFENIAKKIFEKEPKGISIVDNAIEHFLNQ